MVATNASVAITAGSEKKEQEMPYVDVKKASDLLKAAYDLLKKSEVENLKRSADYLKESILLLSRKPSESATNKR